MVMTSSAAESSALSTLRGSGDLRSVSSIELKAANFGIEKKQYYLFCVNVTVI
jgi:hypothetical protein